MRWPTSSSSCSRWAGATSSAPGLLPPDEPRPGLGEFGGPATALSPEALATFEQGRDMFDRDFGRLDGAGGPRFNGDSCRACHFEPVLGGSGPVDVNVMRHGIQNADGDFVEPVVGTILHKSISLDNQTVEPQVDANIFEHRQTPHLFGLGLMDQIPEDVIIANADPDDTITPDGITGRVSWADGGRLGRFGWKAQVPTVAEFVRDGLSTEIGLTLPFVDGLTFGLINDYDDVPDPEVDSVDIAALQFFLENLGPPPRTGAIDTPEVIAGEAVFETVGCASCHIPRLGGVPLYSDLLLHEILPAAAAGHRRGFGQTSASSARHRCGASR